VLLLTTEIQLYCLKLQNTLSDFFWSLKYRHRLSPDRGVRPCVYRATSVQYISVTYVVTLPFYQGFPGDFFPSRCPAAFNTGLLRDPPSTADVSVRVHHSLEQQKPLLLLLLLAVGVMMMMMMMMI
jgi:hypothetical protein